MTYGDKLRIMRAVRNMSQRDLAEATGIPGTYLSNFETGTTLPTEEKMDAIKEALGWTDLVQDALEDLEAALDEG